MTATAKPTLPKRLPRELLHWVGLRAIDLSSSIDHENSLAWGQWCRDVASAALLGNSEALRRLIDAAGLTERVGASLEDHQEREAKQR